MSLNASASSPPTCYIAVVFDHQRCACVSRAAFVVACQNTKILRTACMRTACSRSLARSADRSLVFVCPSPVCLQCSRAREGGRPRPRSERRAVSQAKEGKRMRPHPNIQRTCSPTYRRQMPPCIGTRKMPRQPASHVEVAADYSTHAWLARSRAWT